MSVSVSVSVPVSVKHRQTDKTDRHTDKHIDRQTHSGPLSRCHPGDVDVATAVGMMNATQTQTHTL
eukprot:911262-Rhodomonas_salina.1